MTGQKCGDWLNVFLLHNDLIQWGLPHGNTALDQKTTGLFTQWFGKEQFSRMNLYEVVFWGSHGDGDAEDTIYLVRAADFRAAAEDVQRNGSPSKHTGRHDTMAHTVYEVGRDLSPYADDNPRILRGPYFAFAYNFGWRSWSRKIEGAEYTKEWQEDQVAEPGAAPNAAPRSR